MARLPCGHDAVKVVEMTSAALVFYQERPDEPWHDFADNSFPTGEYGAECLTCGKVWRWGKRRRKLPKWFTALRDEVFDLKA
jgi:hypothetical protein